MVIGLTLAGNAMADAARQLLVLACQQPALVVSLVTLIATIIFSVYLKGFLQLPLFRNARWRCCCWHSDRRLAAISSANRRGCRQPRHCDTALHHSNDLLAGGVSYHAGRACHDSESTAHIYQLDVYVNDLAKKLGKKKEYDLAILGDNLIGDGIGDMVAGFMGGPAGTNYGKHQRHGNHPRLLGAVLITAAIIAMIIACFTPLVKAIYSIPLSVIGGLEIYSSAPSLPRVSPL